MEDVLAIQLVGPLPARDRGVEVLAGGQSFEGGCHCVGSVPFVPGERALNATDYGVSAYRRARSRCKGVSWWGNRG